MRKITLLLVGMFCLYASNAQDLNGVTIGFGFGPSFLLNNPKDYSLSPDQNKLVVQDLSKTGFVISSALTIKFFDLEEKLDGGNKPIIATRSSGNKASFHHKLALNIGINLAEISSSNVSFNKQIDGGIGLGYFFNKYIQLAVFYDVIKVRQMRDYIVTTYEGAPIPNGVPNEIYNALDATDNRLFYNKTFTGLSAKIVIALNPKK